MVKLLTRPVRLSGLGDAGTLDFSSMPALATTPGGGVDWSQLTFPAVGANDFTLPTQAVQSGSPFDLASLGREITAGAQTWFGTQAAVNNAEAAAQLSKARNQAAVNIAKAGGQNAARTAGAGLPSPSLLLVAGLGLAALMLLKK